MAFNHQNRGNVQGARGFKWLKTLQGLALAELVSAALILFLAIVSVTILAVSNDMTMLISFPIISFVCGIFGIVSGGLGVGAFRNGGQCRKCLVISHFVFCIIAAIIDFAHVITTASFLAYLHATSYMSAYHRRDGSEYRNSYEYQYDNRGAIKGSLTFGWMILLITVNHMICSIVSTAFTCNNWCCGSTVDVSVIYKEQKSNANSDLVDIALQNKQPSAPPDTNLIGKWNKGI